LSRRCHHALLVLLPLRILLLLLELLLLELLLLEVLELRSEQVLGWLVHGVGVSPKVCSTGHSSSSTLPAAGNSGTSRQGRSGQGQMRRRQRQSGHRCRV